MNYHKIVWYYHVDNCILAAYKYVRKTGFKVKHVFRKNKKGEQIGLGLESEDGRFFMMNMINHNQSTKRELARRIRKMGISCADFINRQLIAFL